MKIRTGVAAMGLLVLSGCASGASGQAVSPSSTPTATEQALGSIRGTVAVEADWLANVQSGQNAVGGPCTVKAGYDDQKAGAQVVVTDASGTTVGLGSLNDKGLQILDGSTDMSDTWCEFSFLVDNVPKGEGYYGVAVGSRDAIQFTEDEAFSQPELSLGDIPVG